MTTYGALAAMNREVGGGVVELRADMLAETSESFVHEQIALIRRHLPEDVPLRFVLRTIHQGGRFEGSEEEVFQILGYALKAGVEIIDVELHQWSDVAQDALRDQCRNARLRPFLRTPML
jgi:3-dehydroquinate dehydratase type I